MAIKKRTPEVTESAARHYAGRFIGRRIILVVIIAVSILFFVALMMIILQKGSISPAAQISGEFATEQSWVQDFTAMPNGSIDSRVWRYELDPSVPGYNNEAQAYTHDNRNVRIENGALVLEAHREEQAYKYPTDTSGNEFKFTSGRIDTRGTFDFEYGKFEIRARLPTGKGTWPAFWFLSSTQPFTEKIHPTDNERGRENFYKHDGELDAVEQYGDKPGMIEGTLHTFAKESTFRTPLPVDGEFHTFGIELSPAKVQWMLDGKVYGTVIKPSDNADEWPFGQGNRFYPILNLAMGGPGGEPDSNVNSWKMEIRKVQYFKLLEHIPK